MVIKHREYPVDNCMIRLSYSDVEREEEVDERVDEDMELVVEESADGLFTAEVGFSKSVGGGGGGRRW